MKTIIDRSAIHWVGLWLLLTASFGNARDFINQSIRMDKVGDYKQATNAVVPVADVESEIPKTAKEFCAKGNALVDEHEYDKAIDAFGEAIAVAPNYLEAYAGRAFCYHSALQFEKALADLDMAVKLNGKNAIFYNNRGECYQQLKRYDEALKDFTRSIQLDPSDPRVYRIRSWSYSNTGRIEEAIKDLTECLKLAPHDVQALGWRGDRHYNIGQYAQAERDYSECIRIAPTNHAMINILAWTLATCPDAAYRDGKKAVELATKVCDLTNWGDWGFVDTLAAAYAEVGNFSEAVKYEKKALDLFKKGGPDGSGGNDSEADLKSRLSLYEQRKVYHEKGKN